MKTYIDKEDSDKLSPEQIETWRSLLRKGIRGDERQKRMCLGEIAVQLVGYIEEAEE